MSGRDVDAIWAQLKAKAAPKPGPTTTGQAELERLMRQINSGMGMEGTSSNVAGGMQLPGVAAAAPRSSLAHSNSGTAARPQQVQQADGASASATALTCAGEELGTLLEQQLPRHVSALQDGSSTAQSRRAALQEIKALLLRPASALPVPEDLIQDWLEGKVGKALLRRFDDPAEACREQAVSILSALLQAAPHAVLALMPYIIPVLEERLAWAKEGSKTPKEHSEELRLQLARLLLLLAQLASKAVAAYAAEVVAMVKILCEDPFHEVNVEVCSVVLTLNECLGLRLQPAAKELVAALLPLCAHKRHRVRVAAVRAVGVTMHQGAHEMILEMVAFRDPNLIEIKAFYGDDLKINFCGKLASDPNPQVRLEFLHVIGDWILNLRERMDHEHRLMPYLISALNDESALIQETALQLLEKAGQLYLKDHAADMEEMSRYLPRDAQGLVWLEQGDESGIKYAGSSGTTTDGAADSLSTAHACLTGKERSIRQPLVLPGPCTSRPSLGARMVVQTNLSRAIHPLLAELQTWQEEPKLRAAQLLRTSLVFAESASHQYLEKMMPVFCKVILDPQLSSTIADCVAIVAAFTPPTLHLQLLTRRLEAPDTEQQRAAALEVLAHVVRGAGPRGTMDAHVPHILTILEDPWLLYGRDTKVRAAAVHLSRQLLSTCPEACAAASPRLLWVLLHFSMSAGSASSTGEAARSVAGAGVAANVAGSFIAAAAAGQEGTGSSSGMSGEGALQLLARACGLNGVNALVAAHRSTLLQRLLPTASTAPASTRASCDAGNVDQGSSPSSDVSKAAGKSGGDAPEAEGDGAGRDAGEAAATGPSLASSLSAGALVPYGSDTVASVPGAAGEGGAAARRLLSSAPPASALLPLLCRLLLSDSAHELHVLPEPDSAVYAVLPPSSTTASSVGAVEGTGSEGVLDGAAAASAGWDEGAASLALKAVWKLVVQPRATPSASAGAGAGVTAADTGAAGAAITTAAGPSALAQPSMPLAPLLCLEKALSRMGTPSEHSWPGLAPLLSTLSTLLQLSGALQLAGLRCLQVAVERQLVRVNALQQHWLQLCSPLVAALHSELVQARLQACYTSTVVVQHLHRHGAFASSGSRHGSEQGQGGSAGGATASGEAESTLWSLLLALVTALGQRMHDPKDAVRSAALQALKTALLAVLGDLGPDASALHGGCAEAVRQVAGAPELTGPLLQQQREWLLWLHATSPVLAQQAGCIV